MRMEEWDWGLDTTSLSTGSSCGGNTAVEAAFHENGGVELGVGHNFLEHWQQLRGKHSDMAVVLLLLQAVARNAFTRGSLFWEGPQAP